MTLGLDFERRLPLPPEACFALWTDPRELKEWWGPKDDRGAPFRADVLKWEVQEGATWAIDMIAPDGTIYRQAGEMLEVDRPRLLRFSFSWVENGVRGPATEVRVRFDADGRGTRLRFAQSGFADAGNRDGHIDGWRTCLDRLEDAARTPGVRTA